MTEEERAPEVTILIVDDDRLSRQLLTRLVKRCGFEPLAVHSGAAALDLLRERDDIALILSDMLMPEMPGYQFGARVEEEFDDVHIIFVSGLPREDFPQIDDFQRASFIQKPFRPQALISLIESLTSA